MGSFNTTCFVSQQTIAPGDEAIIFPIKQQSTYRPVELILKSNGNKKVEKYGYCNSNCYPTAFWAYCGPMIRATYDDYGRFTLDEDEDNIINLVSFLNILSKSVCDVKQGENEYHDHSLEFDKIYDPKQQYSFEQLVSVWDKVWTVASKSRLFIDGNKEPFPVAFAVMHKASSDYFIDSVSKYKGWDGESYEMKSYFNAYINRYFKQMKEVFKEELNDSNLAFACSSIMRLEDFRIGEQEGTYYSPYYRVAKEVNQEFVAYVKANPTVKKIPKKFTNKFLDYFKSQIEHRYIATGLTHMGLTLSPMVYASQDYHNEMGNSYLEMIQVVNKKVNLLVKEKYGEDEEEDEDEVIKAKPKM
jgi:hypothetical protein